MIRIANHSSSPFTGWLTTTVDTPLPYPACLVGTTKLVRGRQVGLNLWTVDAHVQLSARQIIAVDPAAAVSMPMPLSPLPLDPLAHFGGWASVGGIPLEIVSLDFYGVTWCLTLRARLGPMLVAKVYMYWRADEPGLITGEATVTASNSSVPDVHAVAQNLRLKFGNGLTYVVGAGWDSPLVPDGTEFGDGQARTVPFVIGWLRYMTTPEHWSGMIAAMNLTTCAVGIAKLWPINGNPRLPTGFDPVTWTQSLWPAAMARIHTWDPAVTGPPPRSEDTGDQGDTVFVAGECMAGVGPEKIAYLSALKMAARPNHYLNEHGIPIEPEDKDIQFFVSRPHPSTGDLLGKSREITPDDTHGWFGPDSQHWLMNVQTAAFRLTGSRTLQDELEQLARLFLWQQVLPSVHPQWFTAGFDSDRSAGWTMIAAVHLWFNLTDRTLAQKVKDRAIARINEVYLQKFGDEDIWDIRTNDGHLGQGEWWQPYWQSVGSYGLWLAGHAFGHATAMAVALDAASYVVDHAWTTDDTGVWICNERMPVTGTPPAPSGSFAYYGMPLAVAVVLNNDPNHVKARSIWAQLMSTNVLSKLAWMPPETV